MFDKVVQRFRGMLTEMSKFQDKQSLNVGFPLNTKHGDVMWIVVKSKLTLIQVYNRPFRQQEGLD